MDLKHHHKGCVRCLHPRAHGMWDALSFAYVELVKAGYPEAAQLLKARQRKIVNREVRKMGINLGVDKNALAQLMRHHGK